MADTELQQLAKMDRNPSQESRYRELLSASSLPYFQGGNGTQTSAMPSGFGPTGGAGGAGTGSSGEAITDFLDRWRTGQTATNAAAASQENEFLDRFRSAIGGQESVSAMASRIGNELNLPGLRQTAFTAQQALEGVPATQTAATRGFDVNQNQLDRIISSQIQKLAPISQKAIAQQQFAENQLGERLGYGMTEQNRALIPFQTEAGMVSDRVAREVSGYTTTMQGELTALLQKMQTDATMTNNELDRANQLAMAETQFENARQLQESNPSDRYIQVGTSLYDTQTGQWLKAPSTGGGGSNITQYLPARATTPTSTNSTPPTYFLPFTL